MKINRFILTQDYHVKVVIFSDSRYHAPIRVSAADLVRFTADRKGVNCLISLNSFVYDVKQDEQTCTVLHYATLFETKQFLWCMQFSESIEASIEAYMKDQNLTFRAIEI